LRMPFGNKEIYILAAQFIRRHAGILAKRKN
jgi:hypothetical protein